MTRVETPNVGYDQDVFWQDGQKIIHLIDDMDERYRVNVCRFLIDKAAARFAVKRSREIVNNWWSYVAAAEDADWGPANYDEEPTHDDILRDIRKRMDRGEHLDWMRGTRLFRRMTVGVEHLVGPGVL